VTKTSDRRDSGTQYTTKELADEIVRYALEPIVYFPGPAEGAEPPWRLKSSAALLKLKVCDPAVGSGAILVAACRYLAERLVEAWQDEMARDMPPAGLPLGFTPGEEDLELLALRVVTDHCLFGVDRNPMAAEMAKLSLWLTTMAKERPFTFLDHAIHAGDSLLGITSLDQLEAFHLDPKKGRELHWQGRERTNWDISDLLEKRREAAIEYGRKLSSITVLDQRYAQEKQALYEKLTRELSDLEAVGDLLVGATLATAGKGERALNDTLKRVMYDYLRPAYENEKNTWEEFQHRIADARDYAAYLLDTGRPAKAPERRCLHWPLAFPEVFLDPERTAGFDAMVGNPPFLGGKRVSGAMGTEFREYLVEQIADHRTGNADLVAYFYLRAAAVSHGIGMLATNTIAQGDTREVGLDWLIQDAAWTVHRAFKSRPWPGAAALEVAQLWLRRGIWPGSPWLDGVPVPTITSSLDPQTRTLGAPHRLASYKSTMFQGSNVLGMGFTMSPEDAKALISEHPENADVLFPFLNGEDLNDSPSHAPSRFIINFFDWDEDRARRYPCFEQVENLVRPEREKLRGGDASARGYAERWWQYGRRADGLYTAVSEFDRVLVIALTSKVILPAFVPARQVFSHALGAFAYDDYFHFGLLGSAFHWTWVIVRASTLETRIRYNPADCFETFPQPAYSEAVEAAGKALDDHRRLLMIANNEGLTKTYNRVHNLADSSPGIVRLRDLHVELDYAVRDAYGWQNELPDLDHGFHETRQGVRYTVGSAARTEMLDLLLELNHQRYAEEVAAGLHDKKRATKGKARQKVSQQATMLPPGESE
jgi:hypothetical protein